MLRVLLTIVLIALLGAGFAWIADMPGSVAVTIGGLRYETSLVVAVVALALAIILLSVLWALIRFTLRLPGLMSIGRQLRRREKALRALSRGMIAAAAGDTRAARRASLEAERHLPDEPMTLLLKAQAAQLGGDRAEAERVFSRMTEKPETQLLGLRGLHAEARRRGDTETALMHAAAAHAKAPLDWAGRAVLEHHAAGESWDRALAAVDANQAHKLIDRRTANRQRAVIKTAQALDLGDRDPDRVVTLAREAIRLAPDLVPAIVVAGRTLSRKGDISGAAKVLEAGWRRVPHPEIAAAYLDVRPGDSARDRMSRAETLLRLDSNAAESRMALARAALEARDFTRARAAMAPLIEPGTQPTRRMCLLMADIDETEHGSTGAVREWLGRAARAPRDPTWIANGFASDTWAPVSPVDGRLDAFEWKVPPERRANPLEPMRAEPPRALAPAIEAPNHDDQGQQEAATVIDHEEAHPADVRAEASQAPGMASGAAAPADAAASPAAQESEHPAPPAEAAWPMRRPGPRPVMFAQPIAPDDPGPPSRAAADDHSYS